MRQKMQVNPSFSREKSERVCCCWTVRRVHGVSASRVCFSAPGRPATKGVAHHTYYKTNPICWKDEVKPTFLGLARCPLMTKSGHWLRLVFVSLVWRCAWAACRAAMRSRGGVTPPTRQWSARENSDRRNCRSQRRRIRESLRPPSTQ